MDSGILDSQAGNSGWGAQPPPHPKAFRPALFTEGSTRTVAVLCGLRESCTGHPNGVSRAGNTEVAINGFIGNP